MAPEGADFSELFKNYINNHRVFLSNPLIKSFLENPQHMRTLELAVCYPDKEHRETLDVLFKEFYFDVRLISYISQLIYWNSIRYDKVRRLRLKRFPLISDQSYKIQNDSISLSKILSKEPNSFDDCILENFCEIEDLIDDSNLFEAVHSLNSQSKKIIRLAYLERFTDEEIANNLNITRQAVTKARNKALKKIRQKVLRGSDNDARI